MEFLFFSIFFLLTGGLITFSYSVFESASREEMEKTVANTENSNDAPSQLDVKFEKAENGLFLIEVMFYILSAVSLTIYLAELSYRDIYIFLYIFLLIFVIFFQKTLITSIAYKFNIKLAIKFNSLLNVVFTIAEPISKLYKKLVFLSGGQAEDEAAREEIEVLVETARDDGYIDEDEYRLMKNIMHYSGVLVSDVMTPRTVIFSYEADKTVGEVINVPEIQTFSRFPIWRGKSIDDEVVGYVVTKEILHAALKNKTDEKLHGFYRSIHYIPENATLDDAMEQFMKLRQHIFLVVDEYGGIEGLLSLEDILENLLGVEIVDEADRVVDMRELAKQRRERRVMERFPQFSSSANKNDAKPND